MPGNLEADFSLPEQMCGVKPRTLMLKGFRTTAASDSMRSPSSTRERRLSPRHHPVQFESLQPETTAAR